jgi:long-chain fatty acid transport protein
LQFTGKKNIPLRIGYTYSDTPITDDLAFFSTLATAIIQNAFQVGVGFEVGNSLVFNLTYHHGESKGATEGPLLSPFSRSENNPLGKIPNSKVSYDMTVDLVMLGVNYTFRK